MANETLPSNFYELLGLIINKYGYIGLTAALVSFFVYYKCSPDQAKEIVDIFIDILTLNGTLIQYIMLGLFMVNWLLNHYYYNRKLELYAIENKSLEKRAHTRILELETYRKDKKAIELRNKLNLLKAGNASPEIEELKRIRDFLDKK